MNASTAHRTLAATAATALTALTLGVAPASAGVSSTGEARVATFYSNDEYALFTGPPFEQGCLDEGFLTAAAHVVEAPGGIYTERASGENLALLYDLEAEGASDGIELLENACAALEAGDPMPVPVAEGTTSDRFNVWESSDGTVYRDQAIGTLETPDGRELKVHGRYSLSITFPDDGPPQVTESETLTVHALG